MAFVKTPQEHVSRTDRLNRITLGTLRKNVGHLQIETLTFHIRAVTALPKHALENDVEVVPKTAFFLMLEAAGHSSSGRYIEMSINKETIFEHELYIYLHLPGSPHVNANTPPYVVTFALL